MFAPIVRQVADGTWKSEADVWSMDWFVEGVSGEIPQQHTMKKRGVSFEATPLHLKDKKRNPEGFRSVPPYWPFRIRRPPPPF